jgi:hypothetical protein
MPAPIEMRLGRSTMHNWCSAGIRTPYWMPSSSSWSGYAGPAAERMALAFRDVEQGASLRSSWGTAPRRSQNRPRARAVKQSWSITRGLFVRRRVAGSAAYARRSSSSRANHSSIAEMAHGCRMSLMDAGWKSDCWAGTGGAGCVCGGSNSLRDAVVGDPVGPLVLACLERHRRRGGERAGSCWRAAHGSAARRK